MSSKYIFIIDTDSYAGNFERDLCAYVTGIIGDCEVGEEFAEMYRKETGDNDKYDNRFTNYIEQRPDEHGCARPCECWETKGWLFDGDEGVVKEEDWDQEKANKKYRKGQATIYQEYYDSTASIDLKDPLNITAGWTTKVKEKELNRRQKQIDNCKKLKCPKSMPNNSVAIFFNKYPTKEMICIMKERAYKFPEVHKNEAQKNGYGSLFKEIEILGFRLVKETTKSEEEEV